MVIQPTVHRSNVRVRERTRVLNNFMASPTCQALSGVALFPDLMPGVFLFFPAPAESIRTYVVLKA